MNRTGNFGPARACGHRKWQWDCKTCLNAYNEKQRKERMQRAPVYRELAVLPWRIA